jgi:hypothetical protein
VPKLKNTLEPVHLYRPEGDPGSRFVQAGEHVEVPRISAETEDAYIVGEGDNARAFPKSRWQLVEPTKPRDVSKEN